MTKKSCFQCFPSAKTKQNKKFTTPGKNKALSFLGPNTQSKNIQSHQKEELQGPRLRYEEREGELIDLQDEMDKSPPPWSYSGETLAKVREEGR